MFCFGQNHHKEKGQNKENDCHPFVITSSAWEEIQEERVRKKLEEKNGSGQKKRKWDERPARKKGLNCHASPQVLQNLSAMQSLSYVCAWNVKSGKEEPVQ